MIIDVFFKMYYSILSRILYYSFVLMLIDTKCSPSSTKCIVICVIRSIPLLYHYWNLKCILFLLFNEPIYLLNIDYNLLLKIEDCIGYTRLLIDYCSNRILICIAAIRQLRVHVHSIIQYYRVYVYSQLPDSCNTNQYSITAIINEKACITNVLVLGEMLMTESISALNIARATAIHKVDPLP